MFIHILPFAPQRYYVISSTTASVAVAEELGPVLVDFCLHQNYFSSFPIQVNRNEKQLKQVKWRSEGGHLSVVPEITSE